MDSPFRYNIYILQPGTLYLHDFTQVADLEGVEDYISRTKIPRGHQFHVVDTHRYPNTSVAMFSNIKPSQVKKPLIPNIPYIFYYLQESYAPITY